MHKKIMVLGLFAFFSAPNSYATALDGCLLKGMQTADASMSIGALREQCRQATSGELTAVPAEETADQQPSAISQRLAAEFDTMGRDYVITPHNPNYVLPFTYNSQLNTDDLAGLDPRAAGLEKEEVKFQVSAKLPLWRNVFSPNNDLYFGYTSVSWWQLYADEGSISAPFRETNYEPEIFLRHFGGPEFLGGRIAGFDIGLNHQSNGRADPLSRSWNRVMGRAALDYGNFALLGRAWYRIPDDEEDDDNPNEYRYLGYGDVRAIWAPNRNTFTAMVRPGTEKVGYEITWSYPISKVLRVYAQWFNGYGESLIDYDRRVNRWGIGLAMTDYVMRNN